MISGAPYLEEVIDEPEEAASKECCERDPGLVAAEEVELQERVGRERVGDSVDAEYGERGSEPDDDAAQPRSSCLAGFMELVEERRPVAVHADFARLLLPHTMLVEVVRQERRHADADREREHCGYEYFDEI